MSLMFALLLGLPPIVAQSEPPAAVADQDASWLDRVDRANNQGNDAHLSLALTVVDERGNQVERGLEIWQQGDDQRRVEITSPPRLAGVTLLIPDGETIYLYLPAYGRPKRVTGDQRSDAFLGTDFSIEELSALTWAPEYTAVLEQDEGAQVRLALTPRTPSNHAHASARMWVRKTDDLPARIEYLNAAGEPTRRLTLSGFAQAGGRPLAHQLKVEDLVKGTRTEAVVQSAVFDAGVEPALFNPALLGQP